MKNNIFLSAENVRSYLMIAIWFLIGSYIYSQENSTISGYLADINTREAISYANIALYKLPDSTFFKGQVSDTSGYFNFERTPAGNYLLIVSMVGYQTFFEKVPLTAGKTFNAGQILLNEKMTGIRETIITADRLKGKSEGNKTLYYITRKMSDVSSNGLDLVKLIPGVQVDFRRNISLEGSSDVLILVDGIERDNNYLSQIGPDCIERVEILNDPPSKYDGHLTGIINVILKKEQKLGISGHMNMELPGSGLEYFIHPDYNFSFGFNKLNIYTSYNGELISFDQHESLVQRFSMEGNKVETKTDQYIIQKLWSHRFHYGFDFRLSSKSRINFYGYYNPYSQKYSGVMDAFSVRENEVWHTDRISENKNSSLYYSVYFRHQFNDKGSDLSIDLSNYSFTGEYKASYKSILAEPGSSIMNHNKPGLKSWSAKIDLNTVISRKLKLSFGARLRSQTMKELTMEEFQYTESTCALYGSADYNLTRLNISMGGRIEKSASELRKVFKINETLFLPNAMFIIRMSPDKTLKAGITKNIYRPNLYQLNPSISMDDPNNFHHGNPYLNPEIRTGLYLEYSKKYKSDYVSARFFYDHSAGVMSSLSFINDTSMIESQFKNAGTISQTGFQVSGTFKLCKSVSVMPYLRMYMNYSKANQQAKEYSVYNRKQIVFEPGLSSVISFKYDINLSLTFQYGSPRNSIQSRAFSDAFYSITLEKLFFKKLSLGIVSALPFMKTFTYQGSELTNRELYSKYTGKINLSRPLFGFRLSYNLSAGKKYEKANRTVDESDILPNKGY